MTGIIYVSEYNEHTGTAETMDYTNDIVEEAIKKLQKPIGAGLALQEGIFTEEFYEEFIERAKFYHEPPRIVVLDDRPPENFIGFTSYGCNWRPKAWYMDDNGTVFKYLNELGRHYFGFRTDDPDKYVGEPTGAWIDYPTPADSVCRECREMSGFKEPRRRHMVKENIWHEYSGQIWYTTLCINCLEESMGRSMTPDDFKYPDMMTPEIIESMRGTNARVSIETPRYSKKDEC